MIGLWGWGCSWELSEDAVEGIEEVNVNENVTELYRSYARIARGEMYKNHLSTLSCISIPSNTPLHSTSPVPSPQLPNPRPNFNSNITFTTKMHFPTVLALLATTFSASASPVEVEARQPAPPSIRGTFYLDTGCNASPPQAQFTFVQPAIGECRNATVGPFVGTFFDQRTLTRTGTYHLIRSCFLILSSFEGERDNEETDERNSTLPEPAMRLPGRHQFH